MNEIISFTKDIDLSTNIDKIESISLEHTLNLDGDSTVKGDLIVSGSYKINPVTMIDTPFSYKVPIDIEMDSKYDLSNMTIDIDNFTYEIVDNNKLRINVDLILDKLIKKEIEDEIIDVNDLFLEDNKEEKLEIPVNKMEEKCDKNKKLEDDIESELALDDSLFTNLNSSNETYSTYSIYIMNENDSIESVMDKYKVSKSQLEEYNNLSEIKNKSKIIIPNSNE